MLVDDSPTMLMSLEGILSKAGYGLMKATSGEAALETAKGAKKIDMVITDLYMGKMNGIQLIKALRQLQNFRFAPILMLTTESQQDKRAEAKASGATGWLVKPVQPTDLLQVVRQVLPGT
ncbi:MAG: response regulator [Alphaproteobacteria bacterium]|nr:response regulator [Alphaproteobacteria bacterium]